MSLQPLSRHRSEVHVGSPLPFGICDAEGRLLLAQGQLIETTEQVEALLERGAFVDRDGRHSVAHRIAEVHARELPALWNQSIEHVGWLLRACAERADFTAALDAEAAPLVALTRRDADLAIFRIVYLDAVRSRQYAVRHAVHTLIAAVLAGQRLGASRDELRCLIRASLTMNLAIIDLQNLLANQEFPVSAAQRQQIHRHPEASVEMLRKAGVDEPRWLQAVLQHHEYGPPSGYPGRAEPLSDEAQLLQRADVFTAKFGVRAQRPPMPADTAARTLFQRDKGHAMSAALIKEFGVYPPGTVVRLADGELGVVARRGAQPTAPTVLVLVGRGGDPLMTPLRRVASGPAHAIAEVVPPSTIKVQVPLDLLVSLMPR